MKERALLTTFDFVLKGCLNENDLSEAHQQLNYHHYGKRLIPLDVPSEGLSQELKDASYNVHHSYCMNVWADLYSDGTIFFRKKA